MRFVEGDSADEKHDGAINAFLDEEDGMATANRIANANANAKGGAKGGSTYSGFDLVFLDGDHHRSGVKKDIEKFAPLVKQDTGVVSGHDFDIAFYGVVHAVVDWVRAGRRTLFLGQDHLWWVYGSEVGGGEGGSV